MARIEPAQAKMVYVFGGKKADGNGRMKELLGGKGANLAEMAKIGLPVPAGFTITTEVCTAYYKADRTYPAGLAQEVAEAVKFVEKQMGAVFGDARNPLLVSCRSGARVSMPGMMDTVLNIGLNDQTVAGLIAKTGNPRFAYDSYRRFVAMYGDVVMGVKAASERAKDPFEEIIEHLKKKRRVVNDTELTAEDLQTLVDEYKAMIKRELKTDFPENPTDQLWGAISAVFESWNIPRATAYRNIHGISHDWGTAVNVQAMVFGNMGDDSATGVAFSRDPSTGENYFYGEYLVNAQGEDVVAGIRTPQPINRAKPLPPGIQSTLADDLPEAYRELDEVRLKLEKHYREMQDIEFTIQRGQLWMLQCRTGKRTAPAALKIAVDMVGEGLISPEEAVLRISPEQIDQLLHPTFDPKAGRNVIAKGLPASPGAAVGRVVFTASEAEAKGEAGEKVILVRLETSPEDIKGMNAAQGILTARGGMTSHAAVVARGMGKTCVAGASDITVDYRNEQFVTAGGTVIKKGDWLSLDGSRGEIIAGQVPTITATLTGDFGTFMKWVDQARVLQVRTNADTPHDAQVARDFGAEGIGLCRTEHMFFDADRIDAVREMILADNLEAREKALAKIMPMQKQDFYGIFKAMDGLPVTIRTLDPPLHEFLPHTDQEIETLARKIGASPDQIKAKTETLKEYNPMLGHRGCRLGIVYPEITAMQARAIMEAACEAARDKITVLPEIMIPLVSHEQEFLRQREVVEKVAQEVMARYQVEIKYLIGTMIELPRACLVAGKIAESAEFFSFGTNDLTQTTFGLSRDDAGKFLPGYVENGLLPKDPFASIDQDGVGEMVQLGTIRGRAANPGLKVGVCGEHGGDPASVHFFHKTGLNYVSCSPYRVPLARLAAAQAALAAQAAEKTAAALSSGKAVPVKLAAQAEK